MTETTAAFKSFAATPVGLAVLIGVGVIVIVAGGIPLWRAMKYLFKATMWVLLVVLVLALAAGAIWFWVQYKTPDTGKREMMKREAVDTLRGGLGKAAEGQETPAEPGASDHEP
jgi:membrane-bound ClpP family serine protease